MLGLSVCELFYFSTFQKVHVRYQTRVTPPTLSIDLSTSFLKLAQKLQKEVY